MQERIAFKRIAPEGMKAMGHLEAAPRRCGLEPSLLQLVKLRRPRSTAAPTASICIPRMLAPGRERAAAVRAERLARDPVFHRPRACGPGLDRGGDRRGPQPRPGRRVSLGAPAFQREGAGRSGAWPSSSSIAGTGSRSASASRPAPIGPTPPSTRRPQRQVPRQDHRDRPIS